MLSRLRHSCVSYPPPPRWRFQGQITSQYPRKRNQNKELSLIIITEYLFQNAGIVDKNAYPIRIVHFNEIIQFASALCVGNIQLMKFDK